MFSIHRYLFRWFVLGFVPIFSVIPSIQAASELYSSVNFSVEKLSFSGIDEYDLVKIPGCDLTDRVGEPQLPVKLVHVVLPSGSQIKKLEVVRAHSREIPGQFLIYPAQPPEILPIPGSQIEKSPPAQPSPTIYQSSEPYPGKLVDLVAIGNMGSYRVASLLVYPLQYVPRKKNLIYYPEIEFRLTYEPSKLPFIRGGSQSMEKVVKSLVINPEAVQSLSDLHGEYEYLVITSPPLASSFQPLADWKTQKGIPARVVTTDSIYQNFSGYDEAEKIRNFIKYAYQNLGTQWVLLGGDTDVIPDRAAYAMTSGAGMSSDEDSLRADLYYADLDGTWDLNENGIYGEVADSVDLYPEVFVGRAPVNTIDEVNNFVSKILTYEKNPPGDYQLDMLFLAEILWWDPYTDSGIGKNLIDSLYVPPRFDPINKLYQSLGNEDYTTVMSALNEGQNLINHDGHAFYYILGVGDDYLFRDDFDALVNGERLGIFYSIGCWPAAFDYNCIGEHWLNNPNGGGVAFIGNSRYGWGSPGNPGFGYSDRFDATFYEKLFLAEINRIGATMALAKAHYIPRSREANVYRWHQYQINLLGDPEMPIWTDTPKELSVSFPESISIGEISFPIAVKSNGQAVKGALICLTKGEEIYERGYTGIDGELVMYVSPNTPGALTLTVTGANCLPFEDSIIVYSTGPWVGYSDYRLSGGNGDQEMNPGEELSINIIIKNFGNETADSVSAKLSSFDTYINMIDSTDDVGVLQPGDTATGVFTFSVSPEIDNGHVVFFTLQIQDKVRSWNNCLTIPAASPLLSFSKYTVDDTSGGNGNGIPEPGESLSVHIWLRNKGLGLAREVSGSVEISDLYINVTEPNANFGDIMPDSNASGIFTLIIDENCPTPYFVDVILSTSTSDEYVFSDTFILVLGETEFSDDMEEGAPGWSHGGILDLWHLSTHHAHSGLYSWYCGDTSHAYQNGMDCYLESPPVVTTPGVALSFWHWYDVTTYGVDGLYVEILHGLNSDTLDFIGSGGALDSLLIGNSWIEEVYDLSDYPMGDTIRVRFSFVSDDEDVAEGFYIDDVRVGPLTPSGPEPPVLLYPPNSCLTNDETPTFRWSSTVGLQGYYTLQYGPDPAFLENVKTVNKLLGPIYTVPSSSPLNNGIYYWRVKAINAEGLQSSYQTPFSFTLDAIPPGCPTLISPPDGITTTDHTPTFIWSSSDSNGKSMRRDRGELGWVSLTLKADSSVVYSLQYTLDSTFSQQIVVVDNLSDTTYTVPDTSPLIDSIYYWRVEAIDRAGNPSGYQEPFWFEVYSPMTYIRGDADADSLVGMPDAVYILRYKFVPGSPPPSCMDAADADDDGTVGMPDAVYTLKYKFVPGSPPPPAPFPDCGPDPTPDELDCEFHPCMGRSDNDVKTKSVKEW